MARTVIRNGGAVVDLPSMAELHAYFGERDRERARGIKMIRASGIGPFPAAGALLIPNGPESGYIWALRLLSAQLASSGTLLAYITSSTPAAGATPQRAVYNGASAVTQVTTFPSAACMLYPGEGIYLSAGQNINAWFLAGWEVPAEMEWKLL